MSVGVSVWIVKTEIIVAAAFKVVIRIKRLKKMNCLSCKKLKLRIRWLQKAVRDAESQYSYMINDGIRKMGNFEKPFSQRVGLRFIKRKGYSTP